MSVVITLNDVYDAWKNRDPSTPALFLQLISENYQPEANHDKDESASFASFINEIRSYDFKVKSDEERAHYRKQRIAAIESETAEYILSDRLKSYSFLLELWQQNDVFSRQCLIDIITEIDLCYGPWKGIKHIYKEAEAADDIEIFGVIAARVDRSAGAYNSEVTSVTKAYLNRRSWRYMRNLARSFPVAYTDAAVQILKHYTDSDSTYSWLASHLLMQHYDDYNTKDLWCRTPRPLFNLLEAARSDDVREFAIELLKNEFKTSLRDTEASWILRLSTIDSIEIEKFIVWLLKNIPRFEQAKFKEIGFHDMMLQLLHSSSDEVVGYAVEYTRTYARDMDTDTLIDLLAADSSSVSKMVFELLSERDPRSEIGLERYSRLIGTGEGYDFALDALLKHFGSAELTPQWFASQFLMDNRSNVEFAVEHVFEFHKKEALGAGFFSGLIEELQLKDTWKDSYAIDDHLLTVAEFALENIADFKPETLDKEFVKRIFCWKPAEDLLEEWVDDGLLNPAILPCDFYKILAYQPDWNTSQWVADLREKYKIDSYSLEFDDDLSEQVLEWMKDSRMFPPSEIGFDWLMKLLKDDNSTYHDFASDLLLKSFAPADFIDAGAASSDKDKANLQGCQKLWDYLLSEKKEHALQARFARKYFQHHHNRLGRETTGSDPEPGTEIPESFLSYDRIKPLFSDKRKPLREFALLLAAWEFNRWSPDVNELIALYSLPHTEVRQFVSDALFADDKKEHQFYRIDSSHFDPVSIYRFCESRVAEANEAGMMLIKQNTSFQIPEQLFFLTENRNRKVRAFAIRQLWSLYRDKGITLAWTPPKDKAAVVTRQQIGHDTSMPDASVLFGLLRRILFEIPGGRIRGNNAPELALAKTSGTELKATPVLPARKSKLALVETLRDIAVEDPSFATYIYPLFTEFTQSTGMSEQAACLVAKTRIENAHPQMVATEMKGSSL